MGRDTHQATGIPMDAYRELTALLPPSVIWSHHQLPSAGLNANSNRLFGPWAECRSWH